MIEYCIHGVWRASSGLGEVVALPTTSWPGTDIQFYKPLIGTNTFAVQLYVIREDAGTIAAFAGLSTIVSKCCLSVRAQEQGYGSELVEFAIREKHIYSGPDVNEQTRQHFRILSTSRIWSDRPRRVDGTEGHFLFYTANPPVRLRKGGSG